MFGVKGYNVFHPMLRIWERTGYLTNLLACVHNAIIENGNGRGQKARKGECRMNRRLLGFTLIELLVVIAIIAILAAILFPVFLATRAKARETQCMNNMRQIGKAVLAYADVWGGMYPMNRFDSLYPAKRIWKHAIKPYLPSMKIYICPSNEGYWHPIPGVGNMDETGDFPISYAYNGLLFLEGLTGEPAFRMSRVRDPARTIYILESRGIYPDLGSWMLNYNEASIPDTHPYNTQRGMGFFQIHTSKRANWLFFDLHTAALTVGQTCVPKNLWGTDLVRNWNSECARQSFFDHMVYGSHLAPEYY